MEEVAGGLTTSVDEMGSAVSIQIDTDLYGLTAVFKAAYWFTDQFYLFLSREPKLGIIRLEMRSKVENNNSPEVLGKACRDFANSLIDYRVRQEVIAETGAVRDVLLRKAFGEGRQHQDPLELVSDDSLTPKPNMSHKDDPLRIGRPTGS